MLLENDSTFLCRWYMSIYARQQPTYFDNTSKVLRYGRPTAFRTSMKKVLRDGTWQELGRRSCLRFVVEVVVFDHF